MQDHPSLDILETLSRNLAGKTIALGVTGSVAALRSPDLARLFMRHGARVLPFMTQAACGIIHPEALHWACGSKPVCELTGAVEHVACAGDVKGAVDAVVIAPATANTIGKIAAGIDDTTVTTLATTALGQGIPLMLVPAMHEPMYRHPGVQKNLELLRSWGVWIVEPRMAEGKAKIAGEADIVLELRRFLNLRGGRSALAGRTVLVSSGRTVEYIDPVRLVSNNASGKMGHALAREAWARGAEVVLVSGKTTQPDPHGCTVVHTETTEQMRQAVYEQAQTSKPHVVISAAAVNDWMPKQVASEKISTNRNTALELSLVPTPKIIDGIKDILPGVFLVAFRALHGMSEEAMRQDAVERMARARADLIAVNDVSQKGQGFESDTNRMLLIDSHGVVTRLGLASKDEIAGQILDIIGKQIKR